MNIQTSHRHNIQPLFDFSTPQEPLICFQTDSMSQFGQPYHPQITQPQRPNYDNMGVELNYGSAVGDNPLAIGDKWWQIYQIRLDLPPDLHTSHLCIMSAFKDPKYLREIVGDLEDRLTYQDEEHWVFQLGGSFIFLSIVMYFKFIS